MVKTRPMSVQIIFNVPADLPKEVVEEILEVVNDSWEPVMENVCEVIHRAGFNPIMDNNSRIRREN